MNQQLLAISAEIKKNRHSKIIWIVFLAFALAPVFGGLFMFLMKDTGIDGLPGAMKAKAVMFSFNVNWISYLNLLSQAVGIGGVVICGFIVSWLFGREYSDGTAKDLLALPVSRIAILNAKFIYYVLWSFALVLSNLIIGLFIGFLLKLPGWETEQFKASMQMYFITTIMVIWLNTFIAFLALWGRGYLVSLGIVILLLILAQIIGALGFGTYFPWAVPGIYSGGGGEEFKLSLNFLSYLILFLTGLGGYIATILWWEYADHSK